MCKKLFSIIVLFGLISTFTIISSERELPEHIKKHLGVKPQAEYTCRDLTLEEAAQMNARGEEEKIDIVRRTVEKEWGQEGLARFNQMSRQEQLEIFNRSVENAFRIPRAEPTINVIPGAHEQAVASHNAKLRAQLHSSYIVARAKKIKQYDYLAKGSLFFTACMIALYAGNKCKILPNFFNISDRYFGASCFLGMLGSYYGYNRKQNSICTLPVTLSAAQIDELVEKFKKTQEQTIKDVCHLQ